MEEDYCWVCRLCWEESQFIPADSTHFPDNFIDHPEKGVICKECADED